MAKPTIHISFFSRSDINRCKKAARLNKYWSTAEWIRHLINGNFFIMGWKPLSKVSKTCRRGHEYTKANTAWQMIKGRRSRACRMCRKLQHRKWTRKQAIKDRASGKKKRKLYFHIMDDEAQELLKDAKIPTKER